MENHRHNFMQTLEVISGMSYRFISNEEYRRSYPVDGHVFSKLVHITQLTITNRDVEEIKRIVICGKCKKLDRGKKYINDCSCFDDFYNHPELAIYYDSEDY